MGENGRGRKLRASRKRQISALCLCLFAGAGECLARLLSRNECIDIQARVRGAAHPLVRVLPMSETNQQYYHPSDSEPFMNERQRDYFRAKLLAWKEDILRESRETLEHLQDENNVLPDLVDRASTETDRALELEARPAAQAHRQDRCCAGADRQWLVRLLRRNR